MGRITIFSITTCPFCARAKAALSKRSIPYCDINIEAHPSRRSDMLSLTDRLTVPQIFLNDEHVGGGDDLLVLLERWDEDIAHGDGSTDGTPYDRYVRLVESGPDPTDARLAIPAAGDVAPTVQFDLTASRTCSLPWAASTVMTLTRPSAISSGHRWSIPWKDTSRRL